MMPGITEYRFQQRPVVNSEELVLVKCGWLTAMKFQYINLCLILSYTSSDLLFPNSYDLINKSKLITCQDTTSIMRQQLYKTRNQCG